MLRGWPDAPIDRAAVDLLMPNRFGLGAAPPPTRGFFNRQMAPGWFSPQRDLAAQLQAYRNWRRGRPGEEFADQQWYPGGITPWGAPPPLSRRF